MPRLVLTCMDHRIDPLELFDDRPYVLRNAGGRMSDDVIRSMVLAIRLLGVNKIDIVHHTNCGVESFQDQQIRTWLREDLGPARAGDLPRNTEGNRDSNHDSDYVAFYHWTGSLEQSVIQDCNICRRNPLISRNIPITGHIYNIHDREITEVVNM